MKGPQGPFLLFAWITGNAGGLPAFGQKATFGARKNWALEWPDLLFNAARRHQYDRLVQQNFMPSSRPRCGGRMR